MGWIDEEISIGDYVLTGGEIPAMVLADAVLRLTPGVVKEPGCLAEGSFQESRLDYPHYTRPAVWKCRQKVPSVLSVGRPCRDPRMASGTGFESDAGQASRFAKRKKGESHESLRGYD